MLHVSYTDYTEHKVHDWSEVNIDRINVLQQVEANGKGHKVVLKLVRLNNNKFEMWKVDSPCGSPWTPTEVLEKVQYDHKLWG